MNIADSMWTEKYRPKKIDDMVGNFKIKIKKYLENPNMMQHLLLHSVVPGTGKCLGKDTPIIMFDGSIKKVQDIKEGEKLLGPDSKPRIVGGVTKGRGKLFLVKQKYGDDFVCNKDHILATVISHTGHKRLVTAEDYFNKQNNYRPGLKGYKVSVDFQSKGESQKSAYLLGSLLKGGLLYNLIKNKYFPYKFLHNNRKIRLSLLSGLIDANGYKYKQGYKIIQNNKKFSDDIVYLSRSLGFKTTIKKCEKHINKIGFEHIYYCIHIDGDVWKIPCKVETKKFHKGKKQKNVLKYDFDIVEKGVGNYYGFTVDKDGLFLLGDFTVTHNTTLAKAIIEELGADKLVLNSSDDRKIDTIRNKVNEFVKTKSSKQGMRRIVFMDEADGLTNAAQDALRNLMETYSKNALFILTCNTLNKISDAIQSRCVNIQFSNPKKEEIVEYLKMICENENMKYTDGGLLRIIDINYPSIRNCVQVLQSLYTEGKGATEDNAKSSDEEYQMLWDKTTKDKDWKFIKEYLFQNKVDIRLLNKFFWFKGVEESYIKMIQITAVNEDKFTRGGEELVVFITSLIDMVK